MAGDTIITVIGNLTADPELRWGQSGTALASFTIASTPRSFDRASNSWKDGEALFLRCTAWRELAENVAESLHKGSRVIAQGRLQQRSWEAQDGSRRTSVEMTVDEIGPSLRFATASVNRTQRGEGGFGANASGGGYNSVPGTAQPQPTYGAPAGGSDGDAWGSPAPGFGAPGAPADSSFRDNPPF
ncbi:single-stranded DNA-binding protein [uncultured Mobiluncus sp.]|uniref:single-stranded DNA-binding protein n=1 Tax=uncultured Mobiluncus sp. TaxID=293425 RepID=UPI00260B66B4|nr:single-stranded DNA-binding protein [uncultured Mobiluncus sp.]